MPSCIMSSNVSVQVRNQAKGDLVPRGIEALQDLLVGKSELQTVTSFLQRLLQRNPWHRPTAAEALCDEFFVDQ